MIVKQLSPDRFFHILSEEELLLDALTQNIRELKRCQDEKVAAEMMEKRVTILKRLKIIALQKRMEWEQYLTEKIVPIFCES